jgi:nucleotide-binding universal stress UspA family protein
MKILAPFDGTPFSESTMPLLQRVAALPGAEVTLLRVTHEPSGKRMRGARRGYTSVGQAPGSPLVIETPVAGYVETGEQAVDRTLHEMDDYLCGLAKQLPATASVHTAAHLHDNATEAIIAQAQEEGSDVIVMATHSRGGLKRALFGSTTEAVIRSGVAPVLVVHPKEK